MFIIDYLFPARLKNQPDDIDYLFYLLRSERKDKRRSLNQSLDDIQVKQLLVYIYQI
jgi:hypothetical protein